MLFRSWEFACRAGTTTAYHGWPAQPAGTDDSSLLGNIAWCCYNPPTRPVALKAPNGFGLYDMLGNVWERTEDCWHDTYTGAPSDGRAWTVGGICTQRVTRGGAWLSDAPDVRSALRNWDMAGNRKYTLGFRVARGL